MPSYMKCPQAFHIRCLRCILRTRWYDHITNVEVKTRTNSEDLHPPIKWRQLALFGHVARMPPGVSAQDALRSALEVRCDSIPDAIWKRPRGRPRATWIDQLKGDRGGLGLQEAWDLALNREGWRAFATSRCCSGVSKEKKEENI